MLTNKQIKLINSLHSKKGRKENDLFLVEGEKSLLELIKSDFEVDFFVISENQLALTHQISEVSTAPIYLLDSDTIQKLSTLVNNQIGLAVVQQKKFPSFEIQDRYTIVLDGIRDPGNLGTIIRICDWYGFKQLVLSADCTEFYNPKVIISSMGSFSRIEFTYVDLPSFFKTHSDYKTIGAVLNGENIHHYHFPEKGFIILGNESNGIREEIMEILDERITIPAFGGAESLNVGISTAVIADNLKRFILR
ncbi:MAG: TrmH family RNA methyltransferase [Sediminibacterium sp.]